MSDFEEFKDIDDIEIVIAKDENLNDVEFIILDSIVNNDIRYLLVIESEFAEDEEAEATILKEVKENEEDEFVTYSLIEDDGEFNDALELFENNSDEYSIET